MNPFWATLTGVAAALGALGSGFAGWKVITRGNRTTFTANIWKRLAEVESQVNELQAALQQFKNRDGIWLELWHDNNVDRTAHGLPVVQLPEVLRKWPDEISRII